MTEYQNLDNQMLQLKKGGKVSNLSISMIETTPLMRQYS